MRRLLASAVLAVVFATSGLSADTHRFVPTQFYNTYSFAHPPALRVKPGDRVITTTLDASGADKDGTQKAQGPNPQTGPFYVEGAEPGDLLVVRIEKIETNRATAYSGSLLAPYSVDPASIATRQDKDPKRVTWQIDKAAGIARLEDPDVRPAFTLPPRRCSAAWGWPWRARKPSPRTPEPSAATWTTRADGRRHRDAAGERAGRAPLHRRRPRAAG
jgi:hypothetical protein